MMHKYKIGDKVLIRPESRNGINAHFIQCVTHYLNCAAGDGTYVVEDVYSGGPDKEYALKNPETGLVLPYLLPAEMIEPTD